MVNKNLINITPRSDVIFKNIFGKEENKNILESFLESVLGKKVEVATVLKSKELDINDVNDKLGILDVQAILTDGTIVNIEMQKAEYKFYHKRVLFYLSKLISGQIHKSEEYTKIKDVIQINILDYEMPWIKEYMSKYEIYSIKDNTSKIKGVTVYFLQIPKFEKEKNLLSKNVKYEDMIKTKLDEWLAYFSYKNMEVLDMVNVKNLEIEEAVKLYKQLLNRDDVIELYESRVRAEMDRLATEAWYKEEIEKAEAKAEKEKAKSEKALEIGEKIGREQTRIELIRSFLLQNIGEEVILKATNITKEELEKIKKSA